MKTNPLPPHIRPDQQPFVGRFQVENADALAEMRAEQRRLREKRKASGVPDKMFTASFPKGTTVFYCRRGSK